jgi:chemotaxis protein histidine kinase CheA
VIEAHGGTIKLASAVGQGTQVVFTLPLTASVTLSLEREPVVQESADVPRSDAPESQQADQSDRAEQADDEPPGQ